MSRSATDHVSRGSERAGVFAVRRPRHGQGRGWGAEPSRTVTRGRRNRHAAPTISSPRGAVPPREGQPEGKELPSGSIPRGRGVALSRRGNLGESFAADVEAHELVGATAGGVDARQPRRAGLAVLVVGDGREVDEIFHVDLVNAAGSTTNE